MTDIFPVGTAVLVNPNTNSDSVVERSEPIWKGEVTAAYETKSYSGEVIVSYNVKPDNGGLPRNILAYRVSKISSPETQTKKCQTQTHPK